MKRTSMVMALVAGLALAGSALAVGPRTLSRKIDEHHDKYKGEIASITRDGLMSPAGRQRALQRLDQLEAKMSHNRQRANRITEKYSAEDRARMQAKMDEVREDVHVDLYQARRQLGQVH
jgi:hypothetical protein